MKSKTIVQMIQNGWYLSEIKELAIKSKDFEKELVRKRKESISND